MWWTWARRSCHPRQRVTRTCERTICPSCVISCSPCISTHWWRGPVWRRSHCIQAIWCTHRYNATGGYTGSSSIWSAHSQNQWWVLMKLKLYLLLYTNLLCSPKGETYSFVHLSGRPVPCPANNFKTTAGI